MLQKKINALFDTSVGYSKHGYMHHSWARYPYKPLQGKIVTENQCYGATFPKNSTQWVHESNASWIVSAVEIC